MAEKLIPLSKTAFMTADKKALVLVTSDPVGIQSAYPERHCAVINLPSVHPRKAVVVPYSMQSLQILRNLGMNTQGWEVIRHAYATPKVEGVYDLMPHQMATAAFLSQNRRGFCTSTMRTGKTASTIVGARFLQERRMATGCLCIAPKTNLRGVWEKEIKGLYPDATVVILHDKDPKKRKQLVRRDADFYIVNYDGIKIIKDELIAAVEAGRISMAIVDEMTHYSNVKSELWNAADQVINGTRWKIIPAKPIKDIAGNIIKGKPKRQMLPPGKALEYVWGLTGTPGGPEMVYGQVKLVIPDKMPFSFYTWRDLTMVKFGFAWEPKAGYQDKIFARLQPCIRFDKKDIMDLPPVTNMGADASMSSAQEKLYKAVKRDMIALAESDAEIKATTKSALVFRLLQIAQGAVPAEDGKIVTPDITSRIDSLVEIIKTASAKVVIFCAFTAVIDRLEKELTARNYTVAIVDGRVTGNRRDTTIRQFQEEKDPEILLCHPRTTAFGVELAAADTMIFYGPPLSGEFVYQQAVERMSSLKQRAQSVQIVQQSSCTEERRLFRSIREGVSINEAINDLFTQRETEAV